MRQAFFYFIACPDPGVYTLPAVNSFLFFNWTFYYASKMHQGKIHLHLK